MTAQKNTLADLVLSFPEHKSAETVLVCLDATGSVKNSFSFETLRTACLHAAQHLTSIHKPGSVIMIATEDTAAFTIAFFGCIISGMVPVPLPPCKNKHDKAGVQRVQQLIAAGVSHQLLISQTQAPFYASFTGLLLTAIETLYEVPAQLVPLPILQSNDLAYIQYTSGSTTYPKGVQLTHQNVLTNLAKMYRVFNRHAPVRVAGWIPLHHDMGLVGHLMTVLYEAGFGVLMPPTAFLSNPGLWLQAISDYECNSAAAPTFAFEYCCRKASVSPETNLSHWKYAYVGSETVSNEVLNRFTEKYSANGFQKNTFKPVYGLAEATLLVAGGGSGADDLTDRMIKKEIGPGVHRTLIPYLLEDAESVTIHNPQTGLVCADEPVGEIWVRNLGCSTGYYGLPQQETPALVKTGDLGFIKENALYITGRLKDVVIIRGENYAAEDLEICCRFKQPLLQTQHATVCTGLPGEKGESLLVLQEVQRHLPVSSQKLITKKIQENLSASFGIVAEKIVLVPAGCLPRTRNNKLARQTALNSYLSGNLPMLNNLSSPEKTTTYAEHDPVVIVGMACRFPGGADSPEKFWELLAGGKDAIVEVPANRWNNDLFFDSRPAVPGKLNTRWAGFINDVDQFDAALFGIAPFEAPEIDPQQRLLMETSWRLLEHTGWRKDQLEGSDTGVFIGISTNDYLYMKIKLLQGMEGFNAYSGLGNSNSIAANRLSYFYDLKGPSMAIDTACSSSLTALHLAANAILNNNCSQAIAGGVNVILSPGPTITLSQFGMMSPVGRCKTFDASADGYVRSEGCGLVMLKRRSVAIRDNDHILAVLRASVTGQDGHSSGITFPNGTAQHRLIHQALNTASLSGDAISYVEAHGTGTAAGDPVEMEQIRKIYGQPGNQPCYVGAVKANIGHLEAAAGIASVIKGVLMLQKKAIPPQIHFSQLNPAIHLEESRLNIPTSLTPWETGNSTRKLAISSFGFGGALAHIILEEPVAETETTGSTAPFMFNQMLPLPLSAPSPEALTALIDKWNEWLKNKSEPILSSACFTQAIHRTHFKFRCCLMAATINSLKEKTERQLKLAPAINSNTPVGKTCFLFTGQGEHYLQMGSTLYRRFPVFAAAFDRCAAALDSQLGDGALRQMAFERTDTGAWKDALMQPVLFAIQYALAILWQTLGCVPDIVIGHSLGEYAAACIAGCFEPEEGMLLLHQRGLLIEGLKKRGIMATIFAPHNDVEALMDAGKVQIAAINSSKKTVISGEADEVSRLVNHFESAGISTYLLKTDQAYHSQLMNPVLEAFRAFAEKVSFMPPAKTWVSSRTGNKMEIAPTAAHWVEHFRHTVHFADAVSCIRDEPITAFIEIGPGSSSLVSVKECLPDANALFLRSLNIKKGDRTEDYFFLDSVGQCYTAGYTINWEYLVFGHSIPIPGIPFMHRRYWADGLTAEKLDSFSSGNGSAPAAKAKPITETLFEPIHYNIQWENIGTINSTNWKQNLPEDTGWIITGPACNLSAAITQQLKAHTKQVYWMAIGGNNRLRPDYLLPAEPGQQQLSATLSEIVTLRKRESIQRWKLLFVCDEQSRFDNDGSLTSLEQTVKETTGTFILLLKACRETSLAMPVWVVTQNCQQVIENRQHPAHLQLALAPLWGFAKTAFLEHPEWRGGLIDADGMAPLAHRCVQVLAKVTAKMGEPVVAIRNGVQYIQQIEPAVNLPSGSVNFRGDGAFIVTGGLGGLGLTSAAWAVEKGCRHLVLISRKQLPPEQEWPQIQPGEPNHFIVQQLMQFKEEGIVTDVVSADVTDSIALNKIFSGLDAKNIPVRGVLHAAGVNWFSKVLNLENEHFLNTLKIKVSASWALHQLTKERDLDCFILFSSVSSLWGSVDLSHYTAANHFMDMLAHYRVAAGLPITTINWGPWAEAGMSASENVTGVLHQLGFNLLHPAVALQAMETALVNKTELSLIASVNWQQFRPFINFSLQPSLFNKVIDAVSKTATSKETLASSLLQQIPGKAKEMIEEAIRWELRSVMLIESMDSIDTEQRFNFLGLDSLMAISLVGKLEAVFQCTLPNTLTYNYPTIRAVTDYIFELIYKPENTVLTVTEPVPVPHEKKEAKTITPSGNYIRVLKEATTPSSITLYCFPFTGSGASVFESWALLLPKHIQLIAIQLPGREERSSEAPFTSMSSLIAAVTEAFKPNAQPFCFFGHSLGALIAYEVYAALKKAGKPVPEKLLLSGCNAPSKRESKNIHLLPANDFEDAILEHYGDMEKREERRPVLKQRETLLRADLQVLETYSGNAETIDIPLSIISGKNDTIAIPDEVKKWVHLCTSSFSIRFTENGHDLVRENREALLQFISNELEPEEITIPATTTQHQYYPEKND